MIDNERFCIWRRQISVGVRTKVISRLEHFKHLRAMGVIEYLPADLRGGAPVKPAAQYTGAANRQNISFGWYRDNQGDTHTVVNYGKGGY